MKKDITELFCWVDDFCKVLDRHLSCHQLGPSRQPTRVPEMMLSELVTILIVYHQSALFGRVEVESSLDAIILF